MYVEALTALAGFLLGAGVMYVRQRGSRRQELGRLAGLTERSEERRVGKEC